MFEPDTNMHTVHRGAVIMSEDEVHSDLGKHLTASLLHLQVFVLMWDGGVLGGTTDIQHKFDIEFSTELKHCNVFLLAKLQFTSEKAAPCW